ncbi:PAS domain S-box-containing protein [Loktanella fryxellensis]|uniref:histidine kinase n=1 Tax=Loktanella fryxellensis TaxID=245187 RepID=A0A1H8B4B6_9RHOB|nr:HAMP domain-containing sensor histidine kinase [Loktanella fryxellensis]SEM76964.1 PAS domain S-box-containing protein [Loktanella fryxellensis]
MTEGTIAAPASVGLYPVQGDLARDTEAHLLRVQESERLFRASMEHSPIGMALTAMDGGWIDVNTALCDFLGYSKLELMRVGFRNVTHPDDRDATVKVARQMVATHQKSVALEKRYIHADGRILTGILNLTVARDASDVPIMYISQIQDITLARRLDFLKNEFIATVNHELRTPLTGIIGALTFLQTSGPDVRPVNDLKLISMAHRNALRLKALLDDVLEMENLRADILDPILEPVDLTALVRQVVVASEDGAVSASLALRYAAADAPLICALDPEKAARVVHIIISNAIKFADRDSDVLIALDDNDGVVRFSVSNRGKPIPAALRHSIFQPFVQADDTMTRGREGAGLGLAIAKYLVDHLDGTLDYFSTADETRFWVDFRKG